MTTVVEASHCPKCDVIGKVVRNKRDFDGYGKPIDVTVYHCVNEDCNWFNTGWLVSSDERGEVFERNQGPRGQDKTFTALSPDAIARGRRMIEDLKQADERES